MLNLLKNLLRPPEAKASRTARLISSAPLTMFSGHSGPEANGPPRVRTPEGSVVVDPTGKRAGRGAYLCPSFDCWSRALRGSLAHTLKAEISASDRADLERAAETYPREATAVATAAL